MTSAAASATDGYFVNGSAISESDTVISGSRFTKPPRNGTSRVRISVTAVAATKAHPYIR